MGMRRGRSIPLVGGVPIEGCETRVDYETLENRAAARNLLPCVLSEARPSGLLSQRHGPRPAHVSPFPLVVIVSLPCLTPLVLISLSAISRIFWPGPRTTSTSRQLSWSRCTCIVERISLW